MRSRDAHEVRSGAFNGIGQYLGGAMMVALATPLVALAKYFDPRDWHSTQWLFAILGTAALLAIIFASGTWVYGWWLERVRRMVDDEVGGPSGGTGLQISDAVADFMIRVYRPANVDLSCVENETIAISILANQYIENCEIVISVSGHSYRHAGRFSGNVNPGTTETIAVALRRYVVQPFTTKSTYDGSEVRGITPQYIGGFVFFPGSDRERTDQLANTSSGWPIEIRMSHRGGEQMATASFNPIYEDQLISGIRLTPKRGFKNAENDVERRANFRAI